MSISVPGDWTSDVQIGREIADDINIAFMEVAAYATLMEEAHKIDANFIKTRFSFFLKQTIDFSFYKERIQSNSTSGSTVVNRIISGAPITKAKYCPW